jgi:hypothetical protein
VIALPKEEDRVLEIARMLGGSEKDKAALTAARAMIENARGSVPVKTKPNSRRENAAQL